MSCLHRLGTDHRRGNFICRSGGLADALESQGATRHEICSVIECRSVQSLHAPLMLLLREQTAGERLHAQVSDAE